MSLRAFGRADDSRGAAAHPTIATAIKHVRTNIAELLTEEVIFVSSVGE
jgi:hypothetical protein